MKASTGTKTKLTNPTGEHENPKKTDGCFVWRHAREAQETIKGEGQLAEYVARLEIAKCARILAARDQYWVRPKEKRSFEEVIKARTLEVLSGVEGG